MSEMCENLVWAYRAVFTQANVGGGAIAINIVTRERTTFLYGIIGPDDYAADRDIVGTLKDSAGNTLARMFFFTPADNEQFPMWGAKNTAAIVHGTTTDFNQRILVAKGEMLTLNIATPVQNETVTIAIRALTRTSKPTVNTTGSAGTVTVAVTYDKVT